MTDTSTVLIDIGLPEPELKRPSQLIEYDIHKNNNAVLKLDERFVIKNLDTGEKIRFNEVPKHGVIDKQIKAKKGLEISKKASSGLSHAARQSPSISTHSKKGEVLNNLVINHIDPPIFKVELYMEGIDKNKSVFPVPVKQEDKPKFPSMNTVKLFKETIYNIKLKIIFPTEFCVIRLDDLKLEGTKVKLKEDEEAQITPTSFQVEAQWMLPKHVSSTPDSSRHQMPVFISFVVGKSDPSLNESALISFQEEIQLKVYQVDQMNTLGKPLLFFTSNVNIETSESISGIDVKVKV